VISGFILELSVASRYLNAGRIWNLPDLKPAEIPRVGELVYSSGTAGYILVLKQISFYKLLPCVIDGMHN
jgi:hypothetical protein